MGGYEDLSGEDSSLLLLVECFMMEMLKFCNKFHFE
jgi:hypothetical protein